MKVAAFYGLWLAVAVAAAVALVRVSADYQNTIISLQDFRWGIVSFETPTVDSTTISLVLEVQNPSAVSLDFKDLEVYVWLNGATIGKTYARFEARTVPARSTARVPLTIVVDAASLADRLRVDGSKTLWRATGTYKARGPFADSDFNYQLSLDIGS
jgi:LEA14-like dessication related protein